jgi:uncharacterized protein YjbI with pentapeptide repeats
MTHTLIDKLVSHAQWVQSRGVEGRRLSEADLDFRDLDVTKWAWSGAEIPGADFSGKDLQNLDFYACNLAGANFTGVKLAGACLRKCTLDYADFSAADLTGADLSRAEACETIFTGATLSGANVTMLYYAGAVGLDLAGTVASKPEGNKA